MKNKLLPLMMALMLGMGVFVFPVSAYASGGADTTPPTINVNLEKDTLSITASDDLSGVEAVYVDKTRVNSLSDGKGSVLLKDYAGMKSRSASMRWIIRATSPRRSSWIILIIRNRRKQSRMPESKQLPTRILLPLRLPVEILRELHRKAVIKSRSQELLLTRQKHRHREKKRKALCQRVRLRRTVPTILDSATEQEDDKQFYTIKTEAGNVFYLVIDGKRGSENVYFLNGVTESDLMALAEKGQGTSGAIPETEICNCSEKCEAGNVNTDCPVCKNKMTGCLGKSEEKPAQDNTSQQEQKEEKKSNTGMIFFVLLALAAVGGLGYYFKIVRPKQQAAMDDTDEYEDEGFGEGFEPDSEYHETLPDDTDEDETTKDGR